MPRNRNKGTPVTFNIDVDALPLLRAMTPNSRGVGAFISELVRKESREREGRPALIARLRHEAEAAIAAEAARAVS